MRLGKTTITLTTLTVAFFLTFLGMRLSFLDKTSKPKPRPRAVLKFVGKTFGVSSAFLKSPTTPPSDTCGEPNHFDSVSCIEISACSASDTATALSQKSHLTSGRSPPLS
jgi:hypothetical protein